jgi:hypothetical protein
MLHADVPNEQIAIAPRPVGRTRSTLRQLTDRLGFPTLRTVTDAGGLSEHTAFWPCGCIAFYERIGDVDLRGCPLHR